MRPATYALAVTALPRIHSRRRHVADFAYVIAARCGSVFYSLVPIEVRVPTLQTSSSRCALSTSLMATVVACIGIVAEAPAEVVESIQKPSPRVATIGMKAFSWREIVRSIVNDTTVASNEAGVSIGAGLGSDALTATGGGATLEGGGGDDTLVAWGSNNTYRYELGDGRDSLSFGGAIGSNNRVLFGMGITSDHLRATLIRGGTHERLTIEIKDSSMALILVDTRAEEILGMPRAIDRFEFTDPGSSLATLTYEALIAKGVHVVGPSAAMEEPVTVRGTHVADRLRAAHKDFTSFAGGAGNDIYLFAVGDGYGDRVFDDGDDPADVLMFGQGIAWETLRFTLVDTDAVNIAYSAHDDVTVLGGIEMVRFADAPGQDRMWSEVLAAARAPAARAAPR